MAKETAGYSNTPLLKKLGIQEDAKMLVLNFPHGYAAYWKVIGRNCTNQLCTEKEAPTFIHLFAKDQEEFYTTFQLIEKRLQGSVMLWVSWYKKSAGIKIYLTEEWSGLKLVIPVRKKGKP